MFWTKKKSKISFSRILAASFTKTETECLEPLCLTFLHPQLGVENGTASERCISQACQVTFEGGGGYQHLKTTHDLFENVSRDGLMELCCRHCHCHCPHGGPLGDSSPEGGPNWREGLTQRHWVSRDQGKCCAESAYFFSKNQVCSKAAPKSYFLGGDLVHRPTDIP